MRAEMGKIRKAGIAAAVLLTALLLGGCHGSKGRQAFTVPEELDTSRQIGITFWAKNDTNKTQTKIYEKAISDFEKLYPNISVSMRLYTDYSRIYNDVITNIATDTTPDVCITYPDHIATYLTGDNIVVPLEELMDDERYGLSGSGLLFDGPSKEEIIPQFLSEGVIAGRQYALPYMRSTEACYVNKTYVEKLGYEVPDILTWDYVWEVSDKAAEQDQDGNYLLNGQKVMIPFIYKSTDNMMIQYLKQTDGGYSTPEGEILLFNDTTAKLLYDVAEHVKKGAFSTFKISSYPGNFFNAGQCIFAVDSTAGATWMGTDAPLMDIHSDKVAQFETVVRPVPQADPEHPKMISQGPSVCLFNKKDPQEVLASWLFMQYLLTNEVQMAYSETEGYVPVTSKAQDDEAYRDYLSRRGEDNELHYEIKIDAAKLLLDHVQDTFVTPVFNGSASLRDAAGQLIENTAKGVRRGNTVDAAFIEKNYKDTASLYRLDQHGAQSASLSAGGKKELGPLPAGAKYLIGGLAVVWCLLLAVFLKGFIPVLKNKNRV